MPAKRVYTTEHIKEGIRAYYTLKSFRKASLFTNTPRSTLHDWVKKIGARMSSRIRRKEARRRGQRNNLVDIVTKIIKRSPYITASTIRLCLAELSTTLPSLSTVYRAMKQSGFTNKHIHWMRSSNAKDPITKTQFIKSASEVDTSLLISLDEFSAISSDRPRRGWSKRGHKLYIKVEPAKRQKASGIVAIGPEGIFACHVVPGAVNKLIFIDFIKGMLADGSLSGRTILMDNVAFHKSKEILQLCQDAGVNIEFTPPYSPECNPIENFFSVVKDEFRRYLAESGASANSKMLFMTPFMPRRAGCRCLRSLTGSWNAPPSSLVST